MRIQFDGSRLRSKIVVVVCPMVQPKIVAVGEGHCPICLSQAVGAARIRHTNPAVPGARRLVDARPTYGYRRIAALLKRERRSDGLAPVNAKRVYRLMQKHGLLLEQTKSSSCSLRRASRLLRGAGHRHAERDGADLPADLHSSYDHPRAELVAMDA
jgi:HTH-like domain